jgi:chitin disaccharide deacetylase
MQADSAIRLVVNADGFGLDAALSQGILRAHQEGIVTSTSIIGNCADLDTLRTHLAAVAPLGLGVHLTLTGGSPISPTPTIRSLLGPDERFPSDVQAVFLSWAKATLRGDEVEREFDSQVARLRDLGLTIDHLDTCHHVGFLPVVGRAVEAVARRHRIAGVRTSMENPTLAWFTEIRRSLSTAALGSLAWFNRRQMGVLRHGPTSWGYFERGRLDEIRILEILARMGPGIHELICAPRTNDDPKKARELAALSSPRVRAGLAQRGIALCRWVDLF